MLERKVIYNKPMKYKELYKMFGLEFKEGGSRKRQLEKLNRIYNINKDGTYYTILNELNELDKIANKPKLKFQDYIVPLIYTYMSEGIYKDVIIKPKGAILKDLSMINDNFYAVREDPYKYAVLLNHDLNGYDLLRYTEETYKMLCSSLNSACQELADRKLAHVEKIKMMLKVYDCKSGDTIKKSIPLTEAQLKELIKTQKEYMDTHMCIKRDRPYKFWSEIPYLELRDANKWVADKMGYSVFDGYKFIINEVGVDKYIAENFPEMKTALSCLVEKKITSSKRKNIRNIPKDTRHILCRELHSNNNKLELKPKKKKGE